MVCWVQPPAWELLTFSSVSCPDSPTFNFGGLWLWPTPSHPQLLHGHHIAIHTLRWQIHVWIFKKKGPCVTNEKGTPTGMKEIQVVICGLGSAWWPGPPRTQLEPTFSSPRTYEIIVLWDDKISISSELEIKGEKKNRADWLEESSYLAPSGHVDMTNDG